MVNEVTCPNCGHKFDTEIRIGIAPTKETASIQDRIRVAMLILGILSLAVCCIWSMVR